MITLWITLIILLWLSAGLQSFTMALIHEIAKRQVKAMIFSTLLGPFAGLLYHSQWKTKRHAERTNPNQFKNTFTKNEVRELLSDVGVEYDLYLAQHGVRPTSSTVLTPWEFITRWTNNHSKLRPLILTPDGKD